MGGGGNTRDRQLQATAVAPWREEAQPRYLTMFKNMFEEIGDPAPATQQVSGVFLAAMGWWLRSKRR